MPRPGASARARERPQGLLSGLVNWVFPTTCVGCDLPLGSSPGDFLCPDCRASLRLVRPAACARCCPQADGEGVTLCALCKPLPDTYESLRSAYPYQGTVGRIIRSLKYSHSPHLADFLARLTIGALTDHFALLLDGGRVDCIVAVPMHISRRFSRGFNHAELIAEALGRYLSLPVETGAVRRSRRTRPQARKDSIEDRLRNVEGAFAAADPDRLAGRGILLVDDVLTTGATASSCAGALLQAGAKGVHVLTAARAGDHYVSDPIPADASGPGAGLPAR